MSGIKNILSQTAHRPWKLPAEKWRFYQEWNDAIFLHWQVRLKDLKPFVPDECVIDFYEGKPWISMVAFNMKSIRPRYLPSLLPISSFHEINVRTYVKFNHKPGVYFLSIEGSKKSSCKLAKAISGLPYRYSAMRRTEGHYESFNEQYGDQFSVKYDIGEKVETKSVLDKWITERYALFQDTPRNINAFDIHHPQWPIRNITLRDLEVRYSRFSALLNNTPDRAHYSPGVQVLAWGKNKRPRNTVH